MKSSVSFLVNGKPHQVSGDHDATMSLNEYLRDVAHLKGTKVMCREGGCGCCVVTVTQYDPNTKTTKTHGLNSCLMPLYACDGLAITTIEGLGNKTVGYHPIQERLAEYNGSQCGFCSTGMVMNMYGFVHQNPKPSALEVESAFEGNICRCTGFRPIMDAMKSFSQDPDCPLSKPIDIEDLTNARCCKNNKACSQAMEPFKVDVLDAEWYRVTSLSELYRLIGTAQGKVRLVVGNTGVGVYKDDGPYSVYIDIKGIPELNEFTLEGPLSFGACISLTDMIGHLEKAATMKGYEYTKMLATHIGKVANLPVRNGGSWGGNLMMKHDHHDFISDVFLILEAVGAKLKVGSADSVSTHTPRDFLKVDMTGKVLLSMELSSKPETCRFKSYKIMPRYSNAHAYVNSGFCMDIDSKCVVTEKPTIVFGGFGADFVHATKTEEFLAGKQLTDPVIFKSALSMLSSELSNPPESPVLASGEYVRKVALGLFYKYVLSVCGDSLEQSLVSASLDLERPVSSGLQMFDTVEEDWPVNQPIISVHAKQQTSGEAEYVNDIPTLPEELHAAFVMAGQGNAKIGKMDASKALTLPGVVKFITADDIPGKNNFTPRNSEAEEVLCSGDILYAGQALGIIVADSQSHADAATKAVDVTYTDVKPPILNIKEAIQAKSFFPPQCKDILIGDPDGALKSSYKTISGNVSLGSQHHFHLETQVSLTVPKEDGYNVYAATQWMDRSQQAVAHVLGIPCHDVNVEVRRLGGAYGGKISRNQQTVAASALAAHIMQKPVRLMMNFNTNLEMTGRRYPYYVEYEVGFTEEGKLTAVKILYYADCGCSSNECTLYEAQIWGDNAYHCDNWSMKGVAVKTNTPSNTYCRAPGSVEGVFVIETIMEHVAKTLNRDPTEVKRLNFVQEGQVSPTHLPIKYCSIASLYDRCLRSAEYERRKKEIEEFNKVNRWKKRGISVVPMKYAVFWMFFKTNAMVTIYNGDGTVAVSHGGIEMGQGINTKAAQVCAKTLGIPMSMVKIKPNTSMCNANGSSSGGSIASELCCQAVLKCCEALKTRIEEVRKTMKVDNPSWKDVIRECYTRKVDLSERHFLAPPLNQDIVDYLLYGVTCTEVTVDILTGNSQINRVDMFYDCGESLNPKLDIGQIEGAFVMGVGYWLMEKLKYDPKTGRNLANGTWEYKPPFCRDIPIDFRIELVKDAPNSGGVLRSKTAGEPPMCMSSSVLFAVRHAVEAAREELRGDTGYVKMDAPATVDAVHTLCSIEPTDFTLDMK